MKTKHWIIACSVILLIGIAIGVWGIHDVLYPPMQVTDTTQGEWHGVTVRPAIVAASKVPAGVTAQVELTMNFPAQHEWAKERIGNESDVSDNAPVGSRIGNGADASQPNPESTTTVGQIKTFDFISRGGGWFTTQGEIQFNPWAIPLIISTLSNGDISVLTDEKDVTFSVKQAVKVKQPTKPSYGADVLYNGNWGGQLYYSPGWQVFGVHPSITAGYLDRAFVGVGIGCN